MSGFDIGSRHVGDGAPCLIVAEVAQAHEGSLAMAHAYIDAIADAGADAVKFQCHIAEAESTPDEPWRVGPRWPQDESRYAYWKRMEFEPSQWGDLRLHATDRGLIFLCSPFSVEAVALLDPLVPAWKIASGEITNERLLAAIAHTRKPVLISLGMATFEEIRAVEARFYGRDRVLMQCTSEYPTRPERVGLGMLKWLRDSDAYRPVGLSDHSGTIWPSVAAVTLGASVVEIHMTFSRETFGFDVASSVTTAELRQLVEGVRFVEKARPGVDKDALARELEPMRRLFMDKHKRHLAHVKNPDGSCVEVRDIGEAWCIACDSAPCVCSLIKVHGWPLPPGVGNA